MKNSEEELLLRLGCLPPYYREPPHKPPPYPKHWEEEWCCQRFLNTYYNPTEGTNFKIIGKTENVYPYLKGQTRYDWVCRDNEKELAIEIARVFYSEEEEKDWNGAKDVIIEKLAPKVASTLLFPIKVDLPIPLPTRREELREFLSRLYSRIVSIVGSLAEGKHQDFTIDGFKCRVHRRTYGRPSVTFCFRYLRPRRPIGMRNAARREILKKLCKKQLVKAPPDITRILLVDNRIPGLQVSIVKECIQSLPDAYFENVDKIYFVNWAYGSDIQEVWPN
jgi:hypothetical protein